LGKYDEAIPLLKKSLELDTKLAAGYTELGYAQYMKSLYTDALKTLKEGINIDPKSTLCRYYSALVYIQLKDKANAQSMQNELRILDAKLADKLTTKIVVL
jgi:tetratricopeptide (TPR) repeat protein